MNGIVRVLTLVRVTAGSREVDVAREVLVLLFHHVPSALLSASVQQTERPATGSYHIVSQMTVPYLLIYAGCL